MSKKQTGYKIVLVIVIVLTIVSASLAVKEYMSYQKLQADFEKYCDEYDSLWEKNADIYYQLEDAGVKISSSKLKESY